MNTKHTLFNVFSVLFLFFIFKVVLAAIPPGLNYQGHLTSDAGVPVDGAVNMVFAIYDVETGGTALWSEAQSVTVNQGVFSVELGSGAAAPLPPGLFETPLWVGLSVAADSEMLPRRPITSTGFAFKAGDADTLEGISASTLDQSDHVVDHANPHGVSPAQIGAADYLDLKAHDANTSNPHSVIAAQTGAASLADFTSHKYDEVIHHQPYTNVEAVAAMGTKNDANALNHNKYSNANAVAAILAADGAGSTLDADNLDGLQASEIIDAAQDEVRIPVSLLPFIINQPGSYYLTGNLDGSAGGINITTDKVTLDLMGFSIDGGGSVSDYGIDFTGRSSVTIKNGFISNFGLAGIYQGTTARYATVVDVQVLGNGTLGTDNAHSGIYLYSSNSHIERCTAGNNGGNGIMVLFSSKLINNTAYGNTGNFGIGGTYGSTLTGNTIYSNAGNYGVYGATSTILTNNTAYNNTSTTAIYGGTGSILSGNIAYSNNGTYGIYGGYGATLSGNSAYSNSSYYAIFGGKGTTLSGNNSYSNTGHQGIHGDDDTTLSGNTVYDNSNWGIYSSGSNLIEHNNINGNNTSNTVNQGGLFVVGNSRIVDNTLDGNLNNNIYVLSSSNTIENNSVTSSVNGIMFKASGNFYGNNRASGNTTNFNLGSNTQTTSTYLPNISF